MYKKTLYFFLFLALFAFNSYAQLGIKNNKDNSKPIEITADSLEVLQNENKAIFTGDVDAKQGDTDIKSAKMTVFYKKDVGGDDTPKKEKSKTGSNQPSSASKISKVEIEKNVFVSTPKETAQGDKGVYDVDAGVITLTSNVTLTSGKNIVKGQKLVYNVKTGQSKIFSSQGEKVISGKKERVRGVFIPGKDN